MSIQAVDDLLPMDRGSSAFNARFVQVSGFQRRPQYLRLICLVDHSTPFSGGRSVPYAEKIPLQRLFFTDLFLLRYLVNILFMGSLMSNTKNVCFNVSSIRFL